MFLQKRVINGMEYRYVDHSFRIGNEIKKASFILSHDQQDYNEKVIAEIASARAAHIMKTTKPYFTKEEIIMIETEKLFYQLFYNSLPLKSKQEIFDEFLRVFLANSMELEGSTITPQLAQNIDSKKKIALPKPEVQLYENSKKVFLQILQKELRSVILFKQLHHQIYQGIYADAGEFKKLPNTFGYTEKAKTIAPQNVKEELRHVIENYKHKDIYHFLKPLLFHMQYQKVHPFTDGNSRLGRIVLTAQMFKLRYPPFIFRGDMNFQIRETLIEYINNGQLDFYRLCYEQYVETMTKFWRPMIKKYLFLQ